MIIVDGFSSNYLQKDLCPNLYDIAREHYFSKLEPMFGFQGVGAAIYSGALSNATGIFTEFILQRNEIVARSRFFQALLRFTDIIPSDNLCASARHALFRMMGEKRSPISNVIPSQLLSYFSPKLRTEFTEENSLGRIPTIFDILRSSNMSYEFQKPATRLENVAISDMVSRIEKGKMPDLAVFHPCSLDLVGHKFGPRSPQLKSALENMDKLMYRIIRSAMFSSEEITIIIVSDHGMSPVNHTINLLKTLDQLPLELGNDYLVFLDSTIARFWFSNEGAEKLIFQTLDAHKSGQILLKHDLQKLGIDKIGREYGELIFALKERYAVFPDFFRKYKPPKGMHGYAFPTHDAPILIIYAPNTSLVFRRKQPIRHIDITPTILELFNLKIPQICQGVSLLD
jgi:hypothetical protein